ncbi:DUF2889 domain-containing protein [Thiolinea disciformis]|uniref:DUF2889 domain-containing protein n=1 Tax=Thiolinea disciformis TaxID=125614 RepID=UPI000368D99E|nr:DUF2889 domain-containing protein [Thiolinea disciformis]
MPLSAPVERNLSHTRTITCQGYERTDGLWDIEAQLLDTKNFAFANKDRGGMIQAGEALHNIKVRMTVDDNLCIQAIEAVIDDSPFNVCPQIVDTYKQLVGKTIGPGWNQYLKEKFGKVHGCTHITELFGPLATTAFQTIFGSRFVRSESEKPSTTPPRYLNTCHTWSTSGELVRERWPDSYVNPVEIKLRAVG